MSYIPLNECKHGYGYKIHSRNLTYGVFNAENGGFIGIRTKFEDTFLFTEYHWDIGGHCGTVRPLEIDEQCPVTPLAEGLGTFSKESGRQLEFREENEDGSGWYYYMDNGERADKKTTPCVKQNEELFDWLDKKHIEMMKE